MSRVRLVLLNTLWCVIIPATAAAEGSTVVRDSGGSVFWIFANLSYTGMRAQGSQSAGWRIIAFIFGFPGTLLTYLIVPEGGERAYGVDMPRRRA